MYFEANEKTKRGIPHALVLVYIRVNQIIIF